MKSQDKHQATPVPGGFLRRLGAMLYDGVILMGLLLIAAALASPLDHGNQQAFRDPLYTVYLFGVCFVYLGGFWVRGGMTVGMRAWRLRIRTDTGENVSWKASGIRYLVSLCSLACLGLGFAWSLFDSRRRCWHDIASGTAIYYHPKK